MNTTTCFHCGNDFPDGDMLPLPVEGELCGNCTATVQEAAPDLLAALEAVAATLEGPVGDRLTGDTMAKTGAYDAIERARAAIAQAKGEK